MKPHTHRSFIPTPPAANLPPTRRRLCLLPESRARRQVLILRTNLHLKQRSVRVFLRQRHGLDEDAEYSGEFSRRDVLITPFLAVGAGFLTSAVARADEKQPESGPTPPAAVVKAPDTNPATPAAAKVEEKKEEVISSRVYDATSIGEPMPVGKDKRKVWEKLMSARIVYLGEAEQVPIDDDRELELEIVKNLRKRCLEVERSLSLALEAFPCNLQEQLNQYIDKRFDFSAIACF